ncbi:tRNA selenocysteine 1-associated protein 1 [Parasteatoda tepidariorum]|uniref:tRNA selenocysteine-associated protein 1 n=2 Tax=Parasteatoda tepidariorum TaxID=114398 RepID=A0A2L2YBX8_PARTP|nr:tRNA selenocysteine 1-associated protein 1 [Parasteatoda tepidariorum]XP_042903849.1 tRNA selenocysteine 1-associated protein 1 [Parasteatoda tepidariorum]XP_042903851.1 tRNA selenocysteine 1-associated protein 1 [Parasteatoda tepidariorum]
MNRRSTVWIGDLDSNIDEDFLVEAFRILGEPICSVKIIRKSTESVCYGFLEFPDEESAQRVLHRYNGKLIPNSSSRRFKLNHANHSKDSPSSATHYSLFVGDLSPEVDDLTLFDAFLAHYKTVKLAKVIYDNYGVSKGYGFVHFASKSEYEAALIEMQNTHIGSKSVRVSTAQQKGGSSSSAPSTEEQQWQQQYPGYDYQSYYAAWQNYQQQNPYYAYDQRYGAYAGAYQYPQQYSYSDPQQVAATDGTAATTTAQYAEAAYEVIENAIEEHDEPLDVDQVNQEFMQRNEEVYTALDDSRWLPNDNLDPPLIRIK